MNRHVKKCNEYYEKGFRLKHIPGEFNTQRRYVSIEKEGIALDKTRDGHRTKKLEFESSKVRVHTKKSKFASSRVRVHSKYQSSLVH